MVKFRKKPVVIEAITFDELIEHGKQNTENKEGMPWSFDYKGQSITHENDECYLIPTLEGTMKMTPNDILITGVQGEIYPCKKDIFESTYEKVAEHSEKEIWFSRQNLTFGEAIEATKIGLKIARQGWNGKGMFAFMVNGSKFQVSRAPLNEIYPEGTEVEYRPHIDLKAADGTIGVWNPNMMDILAEDWQIVE